MANAHCILWRPILDSCRAATAEDEAESNEAHAARGRRYRMSEYGRIAAEADVDTRR